MPTLNLTARAALCAALLGAALGLLGGAALTEADRHPSTTCHEDEVWTYSGDFPAPASAYSCVPLDNLIGA